MKQILYSIQIFLTLVYAKATPPIDFQLQLDPVRIQVTIGKLGKVVEKVEEKQFIWEQEFKELGLDFTEANDNFNGLHLQELPGISITDLNHRDILEKYGKLRLSKERGILLREKLHLASTFLTTMDSLRDFLEHGARQAALSPSTGFIQFSELRSLVKKLRELSLDLFTRVEAGRDFREICLDIVSIRRPTVDMKTDYKEFCF